jgi:ribosomal protein S7
MAAYESDITRFLREMKQAQPDLERRQREARGIWWDRPVDLDETRRFDEARVPQQPYVYQTSNRTPRGGAA